MQLLAAAARRSLGRLGRGLGTQARCARAVLRPSLGVALLGFAGLLLAACFFLGANPRLALLGLEPRSLLEPLALATLGVALLGLALLGLDADGILRVALSIHSSWRTRASSLSTALLT